MLHTVFFDGDPAWSRTPDVCPHSCRSAPASEIPQRDRRPTAPHYAPDLPWLKTCHVVSPLKITKTPDFSALFQAFHLIFYPLKCPKTPFYFLGATGKVIEQAARCLCRLYPRLKIVGYRDGYFAREAEPRLIEEINDKKPDILWLGLGVPAEQMFAVRNRSRLRSVGLIKTSGGLFDFLSGKNSRAPDWMQAAGFEWAYRVCLEPGRLAGRYATTNPRALLLLMTRTKQRHAAAKD
jgi:exopolysaccharide biosynthesis WecB/TagA/CpsF family protein